MALIYVNDQSALETRICTPRTGAWHIDALIDDPDAIAGAVTVNVNDGAQVFRGTVVRSGVFADTGHLRVVAGAAGLGTSATPRHYQGPSVRTVLRDLLSDAKETLASSADASILATGLDAWTTTATPIGTLISLLLAAAAPGSSWRMLPDGTLWVGRETWPAANIDSTLYQVFQDSPESGDMVIGVDAPLPLVATTFEGRRVSYAEANVGQGGKGVEMHLWFEDASVDPVDRLKKSLGGVVRRAAARTDRIDYGRHYPAVIVSQSGPTVDVQPDQVGGRALLPDMAGVPLLLGLPGASVSGTQGGHVQVGWHGGDPARPYAVAFDSADTFLKLVIACSLPGAQLYLGADGAPPSLVGATHQTAEASLVIQMLAALSALAGASTGPLAALAPGFAAAVTAWTAFQTAAAGANNFLSTKVSIAP